MVSSASVICLFFVGDVADLFSLTVVIPSVLTLVGLGFVVVYAMRDSVDANWAMAFFLGAAAYSVAKIIMWGTVTTHNFTFRFLVCIIGFGFTGAFIVESLRLVKRKHTEQAPQAASQPLFGPTPSPMPATAASSPSSNEAQDELERRKEKARQDLNLKDDPH